MTDARVENTYVDRVSAREYLQQAELFFADAQGDGLHAASQAVLLHNAAVSACDAILLASGLRVTPGDRSHVLRLATALGQIEGDTDELLEQLDASRERRNDASYAAGFVAQASVDEAPRRRWSCSPSHAGTSAPPRPRDAREALQAPRGD